MRPDRTEAACNAALEEYAIVLAKLPEDADLHYWYGVELLDAGRLEEALEHGCEAARLDPEDSDSHALVGIVLFELGRIDEALPALARAFLLRWPDLGDDPGQTEAVAHCALAEALRKRGRADEAREHLTLARKLQSNAVSDGKGDPRLLDKIDSDIREY